MAPCIGILGGTFDPIHLGHLIAGQEVLVQCGLHQVMFMPSGEPPHKAYPEMASSQDRAEMVRLALEGHPGLVLNRMELHRPGKSYTFQTLRVLREELGESAHLFLVIGSDNAVEMGSWYRPDDVLAQARVVVVSRPGFCKGDVDPRFRRSMVFVDTPLIEMASTQIRRRVRQGVSVRYWVPDAVVRYIEQHRLYL